LKEAFEDTEADGGYLTLLNVNQDVNNMVEQEQ